MHCPSFAVADPYVDGDFSDLTNSCVKHVVQSGFTPQNTLLFDHMSRREILRGIHYYPENIRDIHENFTWLLRDNMQAKVEICWGQPVKERMMSRLKGQLSPIMLWGPYERVCVWVEWAVSNTENAKSQIKRFIIFVHHPQAILQRHRGLDTEIQDLHLEVAKLLAGFPLEVHRLHKERNKWHNRTGSQLLLDQELSANSIREVLAACPQFVAYFLGRGGKLAYLSTSDLELVSDDQWLAAARLAAARPGPPKAVQSTLEYPSSESKKMTPWMPSTKKFSERQTKLGYKPPRRNNAHFRNALQAHEEASIGRNSASEDLNDQESFNYESSDVCDDSVNTSFDVNIDLDDTVENGGLQGITEDGDGDDAGNYPKTLTMLKKSLLSMEVDPIEIIVVCSLFETKDSHSNLNLREWQDIPSILRVWLTSQPGLRIDRKPMSTTQEMLEAHQLLCRKAVPTKNLTNCDIIDITFDIVQRYYRNVEGLAWNSEKDNKIKDLMIEGTAPKNIMPRKCPVCKERILDDAHARYKKKDPTRYLVRAHGTGCGRISCEGSGSSKPVKGIPAVDSVPYTNANVSSLSHAPKKRAEWREFFVLENPELLSLPKEVEIICKKCETQRKIDDTPSWTKDNPPLYLIPHPRCKTCNSKSTYWEPTDKELPSIDEVNMAKRMTRAKGEKKRKRV